MKKRIKIIIIVGARPNFIKMAPLFEEAKKHKKINLVLVHTGQHYDFEMSRVFFDELNIPKPNYNLEAGSGSHAQQTAKIMSRLEGVIIKEKPDLVAVVGDVNSALAGALTACKMHVKTAHIEAGPRIWDKRMPEEINRIVADHTSDFLFCPTKLSVENLKKEGIVKNVFFTGDLMYDAFLKNIKIARKKAKIFKKLKISPKNYYLATLHRAENTDDRRRLKNIFDAFFEIKNLVFICHPRTEKLLKNYNFWNKVSKKIKMISPVGYLDMLLLQKEAKKIITDSGGVQREAFWLGVPCINLMKNVAYPEIVKDGWNVLASDNKKKIIKAVKYFNPQGIRHNYFGDGKAARKIVKILENNF
jgi:UDP-N-acetylglucosamine 2-epimerase (non-hydrolysing)